MANDNESNPLAITALATSILKFLEENTEASPLEKAAALAVARTATEEANNAQFSALLRFNMNGSIRGNRR